MGNWIVESTYCISILIQINKFGKKYRHNKLHTCSNCEAGIKI